MSPTPSAKLSTAAMTLGPDTLRGAKEPFVAITAAYLTVYTPSANLAARTVTTALLTMPETTYRPGSSFRFIPSLDMLSPKGGCTDMTGRRFAMRRTHRTLASSPGLPRRTPEFVLSRPSLVLSMRRPTFSWWPRLSNRSCKTFSRCPWLSLKKIGSRQTRVRPSRDELCIGSDAVPAPII